jgi:hypothetical protein
MEIGVDRQREASSAPKLVGESSSFRKLGSSLQTIARAQRTTLVCGPGTRSTTAAARRASPAARGGCGSDSAENQLF